MSDDHEQAANRTLPDRAAEQIIQYIIDRELTEGDKLPNETAFAEMLNVGRGTLREAMKALASRNIVQIRQGSGMYVADQTGIADDPLGLTFITDKRQLNKDLLAIRVILEPPIAAWAAKNATDEEIAEIKTLCAETEDLILAGEEYLHKDIALHTAIAMSSKNLVVPRLLPIIHSALTMVMDETHRALSRDTIIAHRDIVQAIANRDQEAARDAMSIHLAYNRRLLRLRWQESEALGTAEPGETHRGQQGKA